LFAVFCFCREPAPKTQDTSEKQIIVKFKPATKSSVIDSLENNIGLERIKDIPKLNLKVYKIVDSSKTIDQVIQKCLNNPHVEYAEPDYTVNALKNKN
jgi:hypothetical protein